jgi:hypothetical protein
VGKIVVITGDHLKVISVFSVDAALPTLQFIRFVVTLWKLLNGGAKSSVELPLSIGKSQTGIWPVNKFI